MRSLAYRGRISYVGDAGRDPQPVDISGLKAEQSVDHRRVPRRRADHDRPGLRQHRPAHRPRRCRGARGRGWTRTFPLSEAGAAHAYLEDRKAFGRVVLVP